MRTTKDRLLLVMALGTIALSAQAQLRIDIDNFGRPSGEGTEPTYQAWTFGRVPSAQGVFTDTNGNEVSITISSVEGLDGNAVRTDYWKQGVVNLGYKLLADGCSVGYMPGTGNDFNPITPNNGFTQGAGIQLVVEGLPAGDHTLLAWHNTTDAYSGNIAPIDVLVDGRTVSTANPQTCRATKVSESGYSYIHFAASGDKPVVIQYVSHPEADATYSYIGVVINALVFDEENPITSASEPSPSNLDFHVDADDGTLRLSWRAADIAVRHHLMVGTTQDILQEMAVLTDTTYVLSDLYSMNTYYWRIDEEDADGTVFKGETWCFRPRHLAFPGAEGYGRFANGGRGGDVYHVTSLEDDKVSTPGTLRYGIETATGPRTIVFDVAGFIELKSRLSVSKTQITIAGQTAPGRGITLKSKPFGTQNDGITRFIRMRLGGADDWDGNGPNPNTGDGIGMAGNNHSILDHCSISWTIDEAFSSRNANNITLQRTLISEALNDAGHATQWERQGGHVRHGYAASISGDIGSFHHNLLAHCEGRNWSLAGGLDGAGNAAGRLDIFNNIVYNWCNRTTDGGALEVNFVNNYYKMGPDTRQTKLFLFDTENGGPGQQRAYVAGNLRMNKDGSISHDKRGDTYVFKFEEEPFFPSYAKIQSAEDALKVVLSDVGCNYCELDNHDMRMIDETLHGTTSTTGWLTGLHGLIDRESDAEGFQGLNIYEESRPEGFDTDQDGMPDWWELLTDSDPSTADNNADPDRDGFTLLEDYLNWMAEQHRILAPGTRATIDLKTFFAGFANSPKFTIETVGTAITASLLDDVLTLSAADGEGFATILLTVSDAEGTVFSRALQVAVSGPGSEMSVSVLKDFEGNRHEYYDLNGRRLQGLPRHGGVFLRRVIDRQGHQQVTKYIR